MSESQSQGEQNMSIQRRHLASFTQSEMVMLNLNQIQTLHRFSYDLVISEDQQNKIYAIQYEEQESNYLVLVPHCFYFSVRNRSKLFVQMLCLCSQTITVPLATTYCDEIASLLRTYCLRYTYKRGRNMVKFYLDTSCSVSYLDFVTFQAIQFKQKNVKELLAMKKSNSFQYCLTYFKESIMPTLFLSEEDSIEVLLERGLLCVRQMYADLICQERFRLIYELMNESNSSLKELQKQIEQLMLARHVTTVPDEQYDSIIGKELQCIVGREIGKHEQVLKEGRDVQKVYMKIVYQLLHKFRSNQLEINDEKYLFITSKIIHSITANTQQAAKQTTKHVEYLTKTVQMQQIEIEYLNKQILQLRHQLSSKKQRQLPIVFQQKDDSTSLRKSTSQINMNKQVLSIKDLKEPLQMLNFNTPSRSAAKLATLSKVNEKKLKSTIKKKGDHR